MSVLVPSKTVLGTCSTLFLPESLEKPGDFIMSHHCRLTGPRRGWSLDDRGYRVKRAERVRDAARSLSQGNIIYIKKE